MRLCEHGVNNEADERAGKEAFIDENITPNRQQTSRC